MDPIYTNDGSLFVSVRRSDAEWDALMHGKWAPPAPAQQPCPAHLEFLICISRSWHKSWDNPMHFTLAAYNAILCFPHPEEVRAGSQVVIDYKGIPLLFIVIGVRFSNITREEQIELEFEGFA